MFLALICRRFHRYGPSYTHCCHALTLALARLCCVLSPQDLWALSADRRETLTHDRYLAEFYNESPKIRGPFPKKNSGRFYTISDFDREYLQKESRCPKSERYVIENDSSCVRRKQVNYPESRTYEVSLDPPKSTFSGDYMYMGAGEREWERVDSWHISTL